MLYLNKNDLLKLIDFDLLVETIEKAYENQRNEDYLMPNRMHLHYDEKTLLFMPCVLKESFGTKLVTVFPENKKVGLPVVDGLMILNDTATGQVKAILDGQILTAIRTGAVGGAAIKRYAKNKRKLGIIGCGVQGYFQCLFANHFLNLDKINLYDPVGNYDQFIATFGDKVVMMNSSDELVENSEVIITATTSYEPLFNTTDIQNKFFVGIGSFKPGMREYSDEFIKGVDHIIVDTMFAISETGDLRIPLETNTISMDKIHCFDTELKGTLFFKSVGMALFDVKIAESFYKSAIEKSLGQLMEV